MSKGAAPIWEIHINRSFKAPRERVFAAWTNPAHLVAWTGPEGFTAKHDIFDCSTGGQYRTCLIAPDGAEHWLRGQYVEVDAPERLVFTHAWEDAMGAVGPATTVTIAFIEKNEGTLMQFHQAAFASQADRDGHVTGWTSTFDQLDRFLAAQIELAQ